MEWIRAHQLNVMLMLSSVIFVVFIFTVHLHFINLKAKHALLAMELSAFVMIVSDRFAYLYRGNETNLGYWMVRISNFLVFLMILFELASFTRYAIATILENNDEKAVPVILYRSQFVVLVGVVFLIISQFTGLYYSFDETNHYKRGPLFAVCYIFPVIMFIMLLITLIRMYNRLNSRLRAMLLLYPIIVFGGSIVQLFIYGISLNTLSFCVMTIVLFVAALSDLNAKVQEAQEKEVEGLQNQAKNIHELFSQTVEALADAIDAKDKYTHGHSTRVAEYSVRLAKMAGKSEEECEEIYFAGILHDVGKIGIPDAIINKEGKLTDEEYGIIKTHPVVGGQILSRITKRPYLSIGARYHHERYDGKGYPEHLKGDDIPEMARIIAVADAYDAMTSTRSYRDAVPQQKVREEIIKGIGTQFDPKYAKLMLELIDSDVAYQMKEKEAIEQLDGKSELECGRYREDHTNGFRIAEQPISIKFNCTPKDKGTAQDCIPSIIVFDSLNGRVYQRESDVKAIDYFEYGVIAMDGKVSAPGVREVRQRKTERKDKLRKYQYCIEAARYKDHLIAWIDNGEERYEIIFALPDSSKYTYFAITGEYCTISDITVHTEDKPVSEDYIPRIAPKIIYLDMPDGDIPNIEVDNYKSCFSRPVPITENMTLDFTYKSLPTATRIWHCPLVLIFASNDGCVHGPDYREFGDIRFDGESWNETDGAVNKLNTVKTEEFESWEKWKEKNKKGIHTIANVRREGNRIIFETENGGIRISNVTEIEDAPENIYISITGDQCVVADIKIL